MSEILGLVTHEDFKKLPSTTFWQLMLQTYKDKKVKVTMWGIVNPDKEDVPRLGEVIRFNTDTKGVRDNRGGQYNDISFDPGMFQRVDRSELPPEILEILLAVPKAEEEDIAEAYKTIMDQSLYADERHFQFVAACLGIHKEEWLKCPAGKKVHHAYQGGLIIHTAEVLNICKGIVEYFPWKEQLSGDVVFAGASLHDIGKVFTYTINDVGQPAYRPEETLIGHACKGLNFIQLVARKLQTDDWFVREVSHIVASHHTRREFGAAAEPMTNEAWIVSCADLIGSRGGIIKAAVDDIKDFSRMYEETWYETGGQFYMTSSLKKVLGKE